MADMDMDEDTYQPRSFSNDIADKCAQETDALINEATLMAPSAIAIDPKRRNNHKHHGGGGGGSTQHFSNGQQMSSSLEAEKQGAGSGGGAIMLHGPRSWKNSRRSRNGFGRGLPKKGGAGGKGVWGRPGLEDLLMEDADLIDPADPNYDPTDIETSTTVILKPISPKHSLLLAEAEIKALVSPHLLEYYETGDTEEALRCIEDSLGQIGTDQRHLLIRYAIELAMDHKASHRELTSVLLAELVMGHLVLSTDLERAFNVLLENLSDLVLDLPEAALVLGNFLARAVADECIAPRWINEQLKSVRAKVTTTQLSKKQQDDGCAMDTSSSSSAAAAAAAEPKEEELNAELIVVAAAQPLPRPRPTSSIVFQCLTRAHTLLSLDHGLVRLHAVWGVGGALRPVQFLRRQMSLLLREFLSSGDMCEAARCLRALEVPHFHHELVYEAVVMALEANRAAVEEQMARLLWALHDQGLVSPDQMERGFLRVFADLKDISMDVPLAYILLDRFVERLQQQDRRLLGDQVVAKLPSRGRKRFVSEGDHHIMLKGRAAASGKPFHHMM